MYRPTRRQRLFCGVTLASAASLLAITAGASGAAASAHTKVTVTYKVTGSTLIKSVNATAALGPGKLTATVNLSTDKLTANLSLPPATVSFKQFGIIPVTATTKLIQDGPTTGKINGNTGAVTTTSHITLKLTALNVSGISLPVPPSCESKSPAVVKLKSKKGFNPLKGGTVAGTYTIPPFAHCGLLTPLLNATIPGPGNTITLKLAQAKK